MRLAIYLRLVNNAMTLSALELDRLGKVLDSVGMLMPDLQDLARSNAVRDILSVSNQRDFVLGAAYAYVMSNFAPAAKPAYAESEAVELLAIVLARLSIIDKRRLETSATKLKHAAVE